MEATKFKCNEFSRMDKCFSRRSTPECYVVLFACGKVGEVECFVWDRQSGITLAVFREVQPDLQKPFFFSEAGHHILRMKQEWVRKTKVFILNYKLNFTPYLKNIKQFC